MIKTGYPEERTAAVSGKSRDEASSGNISDKALEIVSQGARANPDGENTVAVAESGGETTVYRIFRQRHTDGKARWRKRTGGSGTSRNFAEASTEN